MKKQGFAKPLEWYHDSTTKNFLKNEAKPVQNSLSLLHPASIFLVKSVEMGGGRDYPSNPLHISVKPIFQVGLNHTPRTILKRVGSKI